MIKLKNWTPDKKFTKKVLKIVLPLIFAQMLLNLVGFIDNFMAGPLGEQSMSSVAAANEILFVANSFIIGLTMMVDIVSAQYYGAKKRDEFNETTRFKFLIVVIFGTMFFSLLFIFPETTINMFIGENSHNTKSFIQETKVYLRWMIVSSVVWMFTQWIFSTLSIIGMTKYGLYAAIISIVFNSTFNYLFVYVFEMGTKGLAFSTIGSRILELVFMIIVFYIHRKKLWIGWSVRVSKRIVTKVLKNWQVVLGYVVYTVGLVAQTILLSRYHGTDVLAGLGMVYTIGGLMFTIFSGLHTGVRVVIGHSLGNNEIEKAKKDSKKLFTILMLISIILMIVTIAIAYIIPWTRLIDNSTIKTQNMIRTLIVVYTVIFPAFMITNFAFAHLEIGGFTTMSNFFDKYIHLLFLIPIMIIISEYTYLSIEWKFFIITALNGLPCILAWVFYLKQNWARNITK